MIRMQNNDGDVILILEPGNITNMMTGKPVSIDMSEFRHVGQVLIYWTPDVVRLAMEMGKEKEEKQCITAERFQELIAHSLEWRVLDRVVS